MELYCDQCYREILCNDELGRVDKRTQNIAGRRHTTKTTLCRECVEDEEEAKKKTKQSI